MQLGYMQWKHDRLIEIATPTGVAPRTNKSSPTGLSFCFDSVSTVQLGEMENCWYLRDKNGNHILRNKKRIKCLPRELKLTPLTVAVWYFDDGCILVKRRRCEISTNNFTYDECERLVDLLKGLGISACSVGTSVRPDKRRQPLVKVYPSSFIDFIDMVKPYYTFDCPDIGKKIDLTNYIPPETPTKRAQRYQKLRVSNCRKGEKAPFSKLTDEKVRQIFAWSKEGMSNTNIGIRLSITGANVGMILSGKTWGHIGGEIRPPHHAKVSGVYQDKGKYFVKVKGTYYGRYATEEEAIKRRREVT